MDLDRLHDLYTFTIARWRRNEMTVPVAEVKGIPRLGHVNYHKWQATERETCYGYCFPSSTEQCITTVTADNCNEDDRVADSFTCSHTKLLQQRLGWPRSRGFPTYFTPPTSVTVSVSQCRFIFSWASRPRLPLVEACLPVWHSHSLFVLRTTSSRSFVRLLIVDHSNNHNDIDDENDDDDDKYDDDGLILTVVVLHPVW